MGFSSHHLLIKKYMSKIFVISDTWFNRLLVDDPNENVVDNNEHIIQNWNETVKKNDKVYVLGGFGIGDLFHILVRLNGEIHFLDNYFNEEEKGFINELKKCVNQSSDIDFKDKIYFENSQVIVLNKLDAVLSYFPLSDWSGKQTGTYCFHGLNDELDIEEHNISCLGSKWDFVPVCINDVKRNISSFMENLEN